MAKVLVVDDEPTIREVVGLYLGRDGHEVVSAADGEEALALFRSSGPDLVVLDLMLPRLDLRQTIPTDRDDTEGRYDLVEIRAPAGSEAPLHRHTGPSERARLGGDDTRQALGIFVRLNGRTTQASPRAG